MVPCEAHVLDLLLKFAPPRVSWSAWSSSSLGVPSQRLPRNVVLVFSKSMPKPSPFSLLDDVTDSGQIAYLQELFV